MHDASSSGNNSGSKYFKDTFNNFNRKLPLETIAFTKMVLASMSHLIDLMKDFFILFQVGLSQGGLVLLMAQPEPYIKGV